MKKLAANPLMINTGKYWPMESSTAGDCLAKTGEETEVPRHCDQISAGESGQKPHQPQPSHTAALTRIESGKGRAAPATSKRVNHMSRDQPRLAGNDRCGGLTTGCSSVATTINMPAALEQFRTSQQTCQPTSVFRHHRAGHCYPTSRGESGSGI
jgi:hypothetical protein